jgi:hypothetical protein
MRDFKFFEKGTVDMIDGETYATASFNDDTPEGHMGRRRLYHTNLPEYERQRMETNRYFESPTYGSHMETMRLGTPERHRDIIRRINEQRDLNDNPIRLFQTTTVTKVNPKWWMKIKIFLQEANFNGEILGIIFIAGSLTFGVILFISKLLNAW